MNQTMPIVRDGLPRLLSMALLAIALPAGSAFGAEGIDPDADRILKSMSSYLGKMKSFSTNADIGLQIVTDDGQKLQLSSYATLLLARPQKLHIKRQGMFADVEFVYDGKTLTMYDKRGNNYAQVEAPGTIDNAILAYEGHTGIPAPGADLLFSDPYKVLSGDLEKGSYLGATYIDGIKCDHLAFREKTVDWQLWVQSGDKPLPMKYVITSKLQAAAPEYEITFRDWNTSPKFDPTAFVFSPRQGAKKLAITRVIDEMGDVESSEESR